MNESMKSMLEELVRDLRSLTDDTLISAMLYGSAARGEHDASRSDVNLLLAFEACSPVILKAAGPRLQRAWRRDQVRPYLVGAVELPRVADVFPLKLWDIKSAHVLVYGEDVVSDLSIDPEHLRLRVEQELRNELIRLRWRLAQSHDAPAEVRRHITQLAHRLRTVLFGVLHLREAAPQTGTFDDVLKALPKLGLTGIAPASSSLETDKLVDAAVGILEGAIRLVDEMSHV